MLDKFLNSIFIENDGFNKQIVFLLINSFLHVSSFSNRLTLDILYKKAILTFSIFPINSTLLELFLKLENVLIYLNILTILIVIII